MLHRKPAWMLMFVAVAVSNGTAAPAPDATVAGPPQFTTAQAMQTASNFCTHIREPAQKTGIAAYGPGETVAAGVPYHRQGARVLLQPENGALRGLFLDFTTRPAAHPSFTVEPKEAVLRAVGRLSAFSQAKGLPFDNHRLILTEIKAELVEPNAAWPLPGEGNRPQEVQSAWKCRLTDPAGPIYEVWVDAQTGAIHGGDMGVPGGGALILPLIPAVKDLAEKADEVRVYGSDRLLRWAKKPVGVLSAKSHPDILRLLQSSQGAAPAEPFAIPRYKLEFITAGTSTSALWYVPEKVLLGTPGHWFTAPASFKTWISQLSPVAK